MARDSTPQDKLSDGITRLLLQYGLRVEKTAGARLIDEGSASTAVYVIISGEADIRIDDAFGRPYHVARLGIGAIFGEIGIFHDLRRTGTVDAITDMELVEFSNDDFMLAVTKMPELNYRLLSSLSWKVSHTNSHLTATLRERARCALAFKLMRLHSESPGGDCRLDLDTIAEAIDGPRHGVETLLEEFSAQGAVEDLGPSGKEGEMRARIDPVRLEEILVSIQNSNTQALDNTTATGIRPWH